MNPDTNLLISVPTMGSIHPMLVTRLIKWAREFPQGQVHFYFPFKVAPVDRARNQIADYFLKQRANGKPLTHLFMIDADTVPPEDALARLLSHDKPIVSGITPILRYDAKEKAWETYDNCFTHADRDENGKIITTHVARRHAGLQEIFRCGASCLLIKREVFEKVPKPYFQFISNEDNTEHTRSEDIYFCDAAKETGFSIFVDSDVACGHYKDVML